MAGGHIESEVTPSDAIVIVGAKLTDDVSCALINALNAELAAIDPEPGATHSQLEPEEVATGRGALLVAWRDRAPVSCGAV